KPQTVEEMKSNVVEFDEGFKERILGFVKEKNFMVYCGLLDSRPYEQDGKLIFDMEHAYNYDFLRQSRNSMTLTEIFGEYKQIVIKFGAAETFCDQQNEAPQPDKDTNENENPSPKEEKESEKTHETSTAFSKFRDELVRLQTKPEIILIKHNEQDEIVEEDTEMEGDND
ncbi:MAG: hypothetical protein IJU31_01885, partial [Synergistaceae bacterium]|nr:hypothetical protein [Synergistaceae bacterium]